MTNALQNFAFADITVTSPAATAVNVGAGNTQYLWQSFDVANCELVSPEINCINWVVSEADTYSGTDFDRNGTPDPSFNYG